MKLKIVSPFFVLLIVMLSIVFGKDCGADLRNEKRLVFEEKILEGLMKLLDLKQREILPDRKKSAEQIAKNGNLIVKREVNDRGIVLYSVSAQFVSINEILEMLASYSGRRILIDEDIEEKTMTSVVSVSLENTPFIDIMEILIGSSGLESIVSEGMVFVTLPAKLDVVSSYDYYKEKAVQVYQMAMIKYPNYENIADAYFELGDFYLASDLPTIALQEFQVILNKYQGYPKENVSMYKIGECYELLGDTENALKSYLMYTKKFPRDANVGNVYLKVGDLWRKQKEYQKAIEIFTYIVSEFQGKDIARAAELRLGYTFIDKEDYVSSLKVFMGMKERELFRDFHNEIEFQIGNCYYLMGDYSKAIDVFNTYITYNEEDEVLVDAYYRLADCFFKIGKYLPAFQLYKGVLSEFNDSSLAPYGYLYCGISLRKLKMFENASKILREGFRLYPDSVYTGRMKFEMALCYYEDGNFKRAFDVFENISHDKPNSSFAAKANIYAGKCLCGEKQYQRALEFYQKALDAEPDVKERDRIFSLIGDCYTELGELANAVNAYQREFSR